MLMSCPGYYCGRVIINDTESECGACPRGYRVPHFSFDKYRSSDECQPCKDSPEMYDWLYLVFIAMVPLLYQWHRIDNKSLMSPNLRILHLATFIEVAIASVLTVLLMEPVGTLRLRSCRVIWVSDWYTHLWNPSPNYGATIYCTQEAVYPLYTMGFLFYLLNIMTIAVIRPFFFKFYGASKILAYDVLYSGLYFYPMLVVTHAVFGGIIYFTFPYMVLGGSLISHTIYFAKFVDQSVGYLTKHVVTNKRTMTVVLIHWFFKAYGLIGLVQLGRNYLNYSVLFTVPLPTVFYILTTKFTDPTIFLSEGR